MQIEISNEKIEGIVADIIKARVDAWFNDGKNKYIIRDTVASTISAKLGTPEFSKLLNEEAKISAKNICTKDIVKKICDRISYDVASAFADKYGDY